jgi:hypothetical protein
MVRLFNNANVSDIDPAPMLRLANYQKRRSDFAEDIRKVRLMTSRGMPRDVTGGHFCFHQMPMYVGMYLISLCFMDAFEKVKA